MLASALLPLLTIASIAQGFPLEGLDTPLTPRATGEKVNGPLNVLNAGGSTGGGDPTTVTPAAPSGSAGGLNNNIQLTGDKSSAGMPSNLPDGAGGAGGAGDAGSISYQEYSGDGKSWPAQSQWIKDFETMFKNNEPVMKVSCDQFKVPNPSDKEIQDIHDGVIAAEQASGLDRRFIFAILMQESKGCPRAPTTNGGVQNPGLMQDHAGIGCSATPCPTETIHQMILEGAAGTDAGDGLAKLLNDAVTGGADQKGQAFYVAARLYNTGPSYQIGTDLGTPKYGTSCYSSDVCNRLLGWAASDSPCTFPNPTPQK